MLFRSKHVGGIVPAVGPELAPVFGIEMVWVTVPVGWLINWAISFARYRTGKWRQITPG